MDPRNLTPELTPLKELLRFYGRTAGVTVDREKPFHYTHTRIDYTLSNFPFGKQTISTLPADKARSLLEQALKDHQKRMHETDERIFQMMEDAFGDDPVLAYR